MPRSKTTAPHGDGWGTPLRRDQAVARGIGALLIAFSVYMLYFVMTIAWGGFLYSPLSWRIIGLGTLATIFLGGLALALGCHRPVRRPRPN